MKITIIRKFDGKKKEQIISAKSRRDFKKVAAIADSHIFLCKELRDIDYDAPEIYAKVDDEKISMKELFNLAMNKASEKEMEEYDSKKNRDVCDELYKKDKKKKKKKSHDSDDKKDKKKKKDKDKKKKKDKKKNKEKKSSRGDILELDNEGHFVVK